MAASVTNFKTQVQARIDAANNSLSLVDLLLLRKSASGLGCNESNLDMLITSALDAMDNATPLKDLLLGNKASDVNNATFKRKIQITTSQNLIVPDGVYRLEIWATGAGGAGGGGAAGTNSAYGAAGGQSGGLVSCSINVMPGQILQIVIGAGGIGVTGSNGGVGGDTTVRTNNLPLLIASGGAGGFLKDAGQNTAVAFPGFLIQPSEFALVGGAGGGGRTSASSPASNGELPTLMSPFNLANKKTIVGGIASTGGVGGTTVYPGGGGGSSIYGPGGNGGNGGPSSSDFNAGSPAPSASYGAGGGGASGKMSGSVAGGNGANGIVEIFY